jgi:hypothetical protein
LTRSRIRNILLETAVLAIFRKSRGTISPDIDGTVRQTDFMVAAFDLYFAIQGGYS